MMQCYLCNETVILSSNTSQSTESKNFAVKHGDNYICTACHDVQLLFDDTPNKVSREKTKPVEKKVIVPKQPPKYTCFKCNSIHPLFSRNSCKKNKKKNKKKGKKK